MDWLKTSFAAPDFPVLSPCGIPDKYTGRTLPKMYRKVKAITVTNNDFFVIVPPIPGYSHIEHSGNVLQNTLFRPEAYADFDTIFGSNTEGTTAADQVTAFRYMSQLVELVPTTNAMNWSGHISCYKIAMKMTETSYPLTVATTTPTIITQTKMSITGANGIDSTSSDQYTAPSNLGVFAAATSDNSEHPFKDILEGYGTVNSLPSGGVSPGAYSTFQGINVSGTARPITGWGTLDTLVIRVQGAVDNTFILKTWAAIEFQVLPTSALYQYSRISPNYDPAAIQAYSAFVRQCSIAVSYYENASFWQNLLNVATAVSGSLTSLPGLWGVGANAINQGLQAIQIGKRGKRRRQIVSTYPVKPRYNGANNRPTTLLPIRPRPRR